MGDSSHELLEVEDPASASHTLPLYAHVPVTPNHLLLGKVT